MLKQTASCRRRSFFFSSSHSERKGSQESKRERKVEKGESLFMSCRERMEDTFFTGGKTHQPGLQKQQLYLYRSTLCMHRKFVRGKIEREREGGSEGSASKYTRYCYCTQCIVRYVILIREKSEEMEERERERRRALL